MTVGCTPAAKRARTLNRAEEYFKRGEYDKARIEYLNVLRLDRMNPTAIRQLAIIWFEDGAPVRALPYLKAARDRDPNNLDIRAKFASTLLALGEAGEARKEAWSILQLSPDQSEALLTLAESVRTEAELQQVEQQLQQLKLPESSALHLISGSIALRKNDGARAENELRRALELEPKSAVAHMALANFYLARKDLTRTGEELKSAAELAPIRSIHKLRYADFLARNGSLAEARAALKEINRQAPDYLPAWLLLAQLSFNEAKYDDSLALLENITSRDPENIDAHLIRAQALLAKGEAKEAVSDLEALDKAYANVPGIKYYLARAYAQNNETAPAIAELNKAVAARPDYLDALILLGELNLRAGNFQSVISAMTELLKKHPQTAAAQTLLAEAYRSTGRLDEAAAVIREQIKALPQNAQAYFLLGVILRQQNKNGEAREAFQKTLDLAPDNLLPLDQLVELDLAGKDFASAINRVQPRLAKMPKSAVLHVIEAKIYIAQQAWDQAEATLHQALELDSNIPTAYELLISTCIAAHKIPQAIDQLQSYLAKWPDDARALMTLGEIYDKQKDVPKARDAYEKILVKNPDFVPALNNLAYLYAEKLNNVDRAYEFARKARQARAGDPVIADTLGWVLYKKGDYQQALELFRESADKLGQNPEVQFHLGMASYMMGQTDTARIAFEQALKGRTDFSGKQEAERRLAIASDDNTTRLSGQQLELMVKEQPDDPVARMRLGELYEKEGAFAKAASEYEHALTVNPKLPSALIKLAQLNVAQVPNSERALEFAKRARELAPRDPKVAAVLGKVAYQAGNFTWAYSLFQESLQQLGEDPTVLHDAAWATYSLGKINDARELMEHCLRTNPVAPVLEDSKSFLKLTGLAENPKNAGAAEPEVRKVLTTDPQNIPALSVQAAIDQARGDTNAAISTYQQILKRFPDFAPAQKHLAALYLENHGDLDKAYDLANKARQTLVRDPELTKTLGEISYQRKDYNLARQLLLESARATPLDAKGLYYLGMSYYEGKQKSQGVDALQHALASGLQEPFASEAKRLVAEAKPN